MSPTPYTPLGATGSTTFNTGNARQLTQQELNYLNQQGANLQTQDAGLYNENMGAAGGTQDYLGNLENPLAQGQGGYNPSEVSQIQMTPQQQADMVSSAGISAGTTSSLQRKRRGCSANQGSAATAALRRSTTSASTALPVPSASTCAGR